MIAGVSEREHVKDLAEQQVELYRRQGLELISHFNRETSALDGYRGRQLLELLQNADDAGVDAQEDCRLLLDLSRERLVVANTGKPFSHKGLISLVISDCSPKQLDRNRFIGCKGLGFRSILTWTECPLISSGTYEVAFDRSKAIEIVQRLAVESQSINETVAEFQASTGRWPAAVMRFPSLPFEDDPWLKIAHECRDEGYDTVIVLPLPPGAQGDGIHADMVLQISALPVSSLLFCRHLTQVNITGDVARTWELLRENHTPDHATIILQQDGVPKLWHVYRRTGQVSEKAAEVTSGGRRDFEVAVAIPEDATPNPTGTLCVFFPTQEQLPCPLVMHATMETTDDRNHLVAHKSNQEVLEQLAEHVAAVVEAQATPTAPRRALELIAGVEAADPSLKGLGFVEALIRACAKRSIFPRRDLRLRPAADVRRAPHASWLSKLLSPDIFPEVLAVDPTDFLGPVLSLFSLSWFEHADLKRRLQTQLQSSKSYNAGLVVGRLLAADQLAHIGADGLLLGTNGKLITSGECFFTPEEELPQLPSWGAGIHLVDEDFQAGLFRGSKAVSLRYLASLLSQRRANVEEYRFDSVARALIDQVESGPPNDASVLTQRWRELLAWLYKASPESRQALPRLSIKVPTTQGDVRRATTCYLGPDYPHGQLLWHLYEGFGQDEFVAAPAGCGLNGATIEEAEAFLVSIGVADAPRLEAFRTGPHYEKFRETVVDRLEYPLTVRSALCSDAAALRSWCAVYEIEGLRLPDRWFELLDKGDQVAVSAYLLSSGASLISEERSSQARFSAMLSGERKLWLDSSVPIPNPALVLLRETAWVPGGDGKQHRPSEIMLSSQGVRALQGVYVRHAIDMRDNLIGVYGGRPALESLLTRLGAVSSLETLSGQSLYDLLQSLPKRDPSGAMAPRIYRTVLESNVSGEESPHRDKFLQSGKMWGRHKGTSAYIPVGQLRYNANLAVTKAIESHIPLVEIPRRKSTVLVKQLFGVPSLSSEEIKVTLLGDGTEYDPGSEDANQHLRTAIPFIYALRLARNLDDRGHELSLLRKAMLRVCTRAHVSAQLPGGDTEDISLLNTGERIVVDSTLVVIGEYREDGAGFLTFWLNVAELVAELLGRDVADEVGGVLRCRTPAEMLEVARVRLGGEADSILAEVRSRFEGFLGDGDEEKDQPLPPPRPAEEPATNSQQSPNAGDSATDTTTNADEEVSPVPPSGNATFQPVTGPSDRRAKRRKLVVAGKGGSGGGGRGPLAIEAVTFKVVEAFERHEGRFTIPVAHLRGSDAFGCDLLSVASEAIQDKAIAEQVICEAAILRYIEVKGRSSRTGQVELSSTASLRWDDVWMLCQPRFAVRLPCLAVASQMVLDQIAGVVYRQLRAGQARPNQLQGHVQRQFGNVTLHLAPRLGDEQMGQRHQAHVMMPTRPRAGFVLRHPQLSLAFLEVLLHPPTDAGHQRHGLQRHIPLGIGEVVLQLRHGFQRAANQQPPLRTHMAMTHRPYSQSGKLEHQRPPGTLAKLNDSPSLRGDRLGQLADLPDQFVRRLPQGFVRPYGGVRGHLNQVALAVPFQGVKEIAVTPKLLVRSDPIEMHGTPAQQCRGDLRLRLEGDLRRNAGLLAPRGIGGPSLRQVELVIQKDAARGSHAKEKHAHLAVLLLTETSAPLALHAHALLAMLGKARPVDHAHRADRRPRCRGHKLFVKHRLDFALHGLRLPGRNGEEPLPRQHHPLLNPQLLRRGPAENQGHRFDALSSSGQQQSPQIPQRMLLALAPSKTGGETPVQRVQFRRRCAQFDRVHDPVLRLTSMS